MPCRRFHTFERFNGVLIVFIRRALQPLGGQIPIKVDAFPQEIAYGELILRCRIVLCGRFGEPFERLLIVLLNPCAVCVKLAYDSLRYGVTQRGGLKEAFRRSGLILLDAFASRITLTQVVEGILFILFSRKAEPFESFVLVLFDAESFIVAFAQSALCRGISLPGGFGKPRYGCFEIFFEAFAMGEPAAHGALSLRETLAGRFFKPLTGLTHIGFNALSISIKHRKIELSTLYPLQCGAKGEAKGFNFIFWYSHPR